MNIKYNYYKIGIKNFFPKVNIMEIFEVWKINERFDEMKGF
jgi:hypothetical protein